MKNILTCILTTTAIFSFGQSNTNDTNTKSTAIENKIYDLVFALPEVKDRADYIERQSNGTRHLRTWIYQTPKETQGKYYWVKVGEENGMNFVSHFNFYVYQENFEIKYFDTENDTIISLDTWRKQIKSF